MKISSKIGSRRGFTLIEVMIGIAVLSFVIAAITSVLNTGKRQFEESSRKIGVVQNARLSIERMTRELRHASIVVEAEPDSIAFIADLDGDLMTPAKEYAYVLHIANNELIRYNITDGEETVLSYFLESGNFSYYEEDATTPTISHSAIRIVEFSHILLTQRNSSGKVVGKTEINTRISLRNVSPM